MPSSPHAIQPHAIQVSEEALAELIAASTETNLARERMDASCLSVLTPQQAWDSAVLPLRVEAGTLVCATSYETLAAAFALLRRRSKQPVRFVISEIRPLEQFISQLYDYDGVELAA